MSTYNEISYNNHINNYQERLDDLKLDENLGRLFAIGSLLNLYGIKREQEDLINNDSESDAKYIFIFVLFLSLYIYIRLLFRNKHNYQDTLYNINNNSVTNNNVFDSTIRLFASIFFITGVILSIYFEIRDRVPSSPEI